MDNLKRFIQLFTGAKCFYGIVDYSFTPKKKKTLTAGVVDAVYMNHLTGVKALGISPINEEALCRFGSIDIDAHGEDDDAIDIVSIAKQIHTKGFPLLAFRSQSGKGVHLYCFTREPVRSVIMRAKLRHWAIELGHADAEVFPKSDHPVIIDNPSDAEGKKVMAAWINLPYYNGMSTQNETSRLMLHPTKHILIEDFSEALEIMEDLRDQTEMKIKSNIDKDIFSKAPPCLQKLVAMSPIDLPQGRNITMMSFGVLLKKVYTNESVWQDKMMDLNRELFTSPLDLSEMKQTVFKSFKRGYHYRCQECPLKDHCNSQVCVNREYGIPPADKELMDKASKVRLDKLTRCVMEDTNEFVHWQLTIVRTDKKYEDGTEMQATITLQTEDLQNPKKVAARILENTFIRLPDISKKAWDYKVDDLIRDELQEEIPSEFSEGGELRKLLKDYVRTGGVSESSIDLTNGFIYYKKKVNELYVPPAPFINYLKRKKAFNNLKLGTLYTMLHMLGAQKTRISISGTNSKPVALKLEGRKFKFHIKHAGGDVVDV